jgi:hypothetical protein
MNDQAQAHEHHKRNGNHQERRNSEAGLHHPGEVGTQHQEFAMRNVQNAHQAVLQIQP